MRDKRRFYIISGDSSIQQRLLNLFGKSSIVEIWQLSEVAGTAIVGSVNGYDGVYTGVDLANIPSRVSGKSAPLWGASGDYGVVNAAGFLAAINTATFTVGVLAKVAAAGVWTDANNRFMFEMIVDANNRIDMLKTSTDNMLQLRHIAGGNFNLVQSTTFGGNTDWNSFALTGSEAANQTIAYANGSQLGTTQICSALTGTIAALYIGAASAAPASVWSGWLSYLYLLNRVATPAEISQANRIMGG